MVRKLTLVVKTYCWDLMTLPDDITVALFCSHQEDSDVDMNISRSPAKLEISVSKLVTALLHL